MRVLAWVVQHFLNPVLFWNQSSAIYDYIEANNSAAALALDELFAEKAGRLVDHPGLGQPGRITGP